MPLTWTIILLALGVATATGASASPTAPSQNTATFVGCYDTSSADFAPAMFRVPHTTSLDDCLNVCDPSFGMTYAFWDESASICRCTNRAQSVKALVTESQEGVCPPDMSIGVAINQPWDLASCISSPNDSAGRSALAATPIRISVPDECFAHCGDIADWAYMVPLPSLGEYHCGCGHQYTDPGSTTKCGTGSWYVFGKSTSEAVQGLLQGVTS